MKKERLISQIFVLTVAMISDCSGSNITHKLQTVLLSHHSDGLWKMQRAEIEKLIIAGGHPDVFGVIGRPIELALRHNDLELIEFLLRCNAIVCDTDICLAKICDIASRLVRANPGLIEFKTSDNHTLLHIVCMNNEYDPRLISYYHRHGVDVYAVDTTGCTALHQLALHAPIFTVEEILIRCQYILKDLNFPARIRVCTMRNKEGKTVSELAQDNKSEAACSLIKYLNYILQ